MLTRKQQITSDTSVPQYSQQIGRDKQGNAVKLSQELTPITGTMSSSLTAIQLRQMKKQQEYRQKEQKRRQITQIQNISNGFRYPETSNNSPYRSMGRIRRLLKSNVKSCIQAQQQIEQNKDNIPPKTEFKMKELQKKDLAVGQKRQSSTSNDKLELESRYLTIETKADSQEQLNTQTQKADISTFSFADEEGFEIVQPMGQIADWKSRPIFLKSTKTNEKFQFMLHNEDTLQFMEDALKFNPDRKINDYCLDKLELEYDYDTDEEQVYRAKKHLVTEQKMAIEFFVKDDPLMLVGNLKYPPIYKQE